MNNREYMTLALENAKKALGEGEVPVGAVIVCENKVIAQGYNKRETKRSALSHAEIEAIDEACRVLSSWRLSGCTMYVTLEPCPMCTGAIINAKLDRVVFGAYDEKAGCMGSLTNLTALPFNHCPSIVGGYMEKEAQALLTDFFEDLRSKKDAESKKLKIKKKIEKKY